MTRRHLAKRHSRIGVADPDRLSLVDPTTKQTYILVRAEVYERFGALLDEEEFDIRETYGAQDTAAARAWSHPEDAAYDDYDASHARR